MKVMSVREIFRSYNNDETLYVIAVRMKEIAFATHFSVAEGCCTKIWEEITIGKYDKHLDTSAKN